METTNPNPDAAVKGMVFSNVEDAAFKDTIFDKVDVVYFSQPCQGFFSSEPKNNDIRPSAVIATLRKAGFLLKEGTGDENKEVSLASIIAKAYNAGKEVVVVPSSSRNMKGETCGSALKVRGNSPKTLTLVLDIDAWHALPPCEGFSKMEEITTINWMIHASPPCQGFNKIEMSVEKKKATDDSNNEKGGDAAVVHRSSGLAANVVFALLLLTMITAALVVAWLLVNYYYNNMLAFTSSNTNVDIGDGDEEGDHELGDDDGAAVVKKFLRGSAFAFLEE